VGIKPTVGLTSRTGVIPIAHSQDTVGPFGRTVADAATVLSIIAGWDPADAATEIVRGGPAIDYRRCLDPGAVRGMRVGIPRRRYYGYNAAVDAAAEQAIAVVRDLGAEIVDPADIPTADAMHQSGTELEVLLYEFKADIDAYLAALPHSPVRSLAGLIQFNLEHTDRELALFGQDIFEQAQEKGPLTDPAYGEALAASRRLSRVEGIDAVMDRYRLDALLAPTGSPPWRVGVDESAQHGGSSSQPAAMAGYPAITVPAGYDGDLPIGVTFFGRALSEPVLIALAHAYEAATQLRRDPHGSRQP
ncbi:MAG TPA: amidase family protein, partial [Chloroflexota bacterium]|nr:amidase family protein [Chloroflexota bacterium]